MSLITAIRSGETLTALLIILSRAFVVFCCIPIHECAHAWVAHKLGDDTARLSGRLTLNPFAHFDPIGTIMIFLFGIGYAKGVPVNPRNFKDYKKGFALTSLAGPVSNLIMAFIAQFIFVGISAFNKGQNAGVNAVAYFFFYAASVNVSLAVFNFLPIPPLDGSRILGLFMSDKVYTKYLQYERYIMIGLIVLLFTGALDGIIGAVSSFVLRVITYIPEFIFGRIF